MRVNIPLKSGAIGSVTPIDQNDIGKINRLYEKIICDHEQPDRRDHVELAAKHARRLADHFGTLLDANDRIRLEYAMIAHDLLKGDSQASSQDMVDVDGYAVPLNLNRYVRLNLEVLQPYLLDDYFNTSIQLHSLAAGIFLIKEFAISDSRILYPIFFHSCPILSMYKTLEPTTKLMVDIAVLADKLSSNQLRRESDRPVPVNLELAVYGESGLEFNFTTGLFLARLIGHGKSKEKYSREMTEYYYQQAQNVNPLLRKLRGLPTLETK